MNQTSRTDEPYEGDDGYNQSPNALSNDLMTNQDLAGRANARTRRDAAAAAETAADAGQAIRLDDPPPAEPAKPPAAVPRAAPPNLAGPPSPSARVPGQSPGKGDAFPQASGSSAPGPGSDDAASTASSRRRRPAWRSPFSRVKYELLTFGKFIGPGFLVSVAYIDPGNYSTGIAAGSSYQFRLLFVVLMSNLFAIFLQSLCTKLGTVTGLNLAEACRAHLPPWMNYFLYFLAEVAIIATDIAEVIGTAIALNLLIPQLPLVAGCALSIIDVMIILVFYRPQGSMKGLRLFECFVMVLVLAVVVCFCIQLSLIDDSTTPGHVLSGYIPNSSVTQSEGLYQACGILGATVMPHSLYLGSGLVQSRLRDYDSQHGLLPAEPASAASSLHDGKDGAKTYYLPSLRAIQHSLKYSYTETALSLFTFALFVNSAILIVAGASLYDNPDALEADIFGIHDLLASSITPAAGTIFALALLFSGVSAGIVCTISGQMVSEGALRWRMKPWLRRLVTRSISITPSIIIAGATGRDKLTDALNGSQVALSIVLPFVTAPLIWFTCFPKYMTVRSGAARFRREGGREDGGDPLPAGPTTLVGDGGGGDDDDAAERGTARDPADVAAPRLVNMANKWWVCALAAFIWLIITVMNVANIVLLGLGKA